MDDYISWEECIKDLREYEKTAFSGLTVIGCMSRIKRIPAADVRPVVRSRWKAHGDCGVTECPVCRWSIEECIDYNFCPNCGADMREPNLDTTKGERRDESSG